MWNNSLMEQQGLNLVNLKQYDNAALPFDAAICRDGYRLRIEKDQMTRILCGTVIDTIVRFCHL